MTEAPALPVRRHVGLRPHGPGLGTFADLRRTSGFLVSDARGRVVGRVECPIYGTAKEKPDALSVRFGVLRWRRRIVPAGSIVHIDEGMKLIGLGIEREAIRTFV